MSPKHLWGTKTVLRIKPAAMKVISLSVPEPFKVHCTESGHFWEHCTLVTEPQFESRIYAFSSFQRFNGPFHPTFCNGTGRRCFFSHPLFLSSSHTLIFWLSVPSRCCPSGSLPDWHLLGSHQHRPQVRSPETGPWPDLSSVEGRVGLRGGHPGRGGIRGGRYHAGSLPRQAEGENGSGAKTVVCYSERNASSVLELYHLYSSRQIKLTRTLVAPVHPGDTCPQQDSVGCQAIKISMDTALSVTKSLKA